VELWTTSVLRRAFPFIAKKKEKIWKVDNPIFNGGQVGGKKVDKWKAFKKSELGIRNIYTTKRIKIQKNEVIHKSYAHFG